MENLFQGINEESFIKLKSLFKHIFRNEELFL